MSSALTLYTAFVASARRARDAGQLTDEQFDALVEQYDQDYRADSRRELVEEHYWSSEELAEIADADYDARSDR